MYCEVFLVSDYHDFLPDRKMIKKRLIIGAFFLSFSAEAQYASLSAPEIQALKGLIKTDRQVRVQYQRIQRQAQKALTQTPNPVEKITSEGLLMGNPAKTASLKAVEDASKIYALALGYRMSGNQIYLSKAQDYLIAWAGLNKATGDPIDETKLEDVFIGYDLIRNEVALQQRKIIDGWLYTIADNELTSKYAAPGKTTAKNNWNSHRIKIITQIAYTIHANKYRDTINKEIEKQINQNLYSNGSSFDFEERDALHYHVYTLEPLLKALIVVNRATGKNYYNYESPAKGSVKKSVDFLQPFVTGEKTHGEFTNSKVKFDRDRAANGEKGYIPGNLFDPRSGLVVFSLAAYFDPKNALKVIEKAVGKNYADWQLVLSKVKSTVAK